MQLPFPGMDPYLELPGLWPDVHASLAFEIRDQIQPHLSPLYTAALTPYFVSEKIAPAPLTGLVAMDLPTRYQRIEIRTVGEETLVTVIEILSPANKRQGIDGADAYDRKRREILRSEAHLLEIDLLRGGRRPALTTALPDRPYFIFLSRVERRPEVEIWPIPLQQPIPLLPIPLRSPDPDVPLDLAAVLHRVYTSARYNLRIDYQQPPPPPELPADDAAWLDAHLRLQGLR